MRLAPGRVEQAHANASGVCCLLIDLNKFKPINDTHGHHIGDLFLKGVGKVLRRGLQRNDLVARVGGDEFVALVSDIHRNDARGVAARIAQRLNGTRLRLQEGLEFPVSASVGAAFSDQNLDHPAIVESLLRLADEAMYARKAQSSVEPCFLIQEPADPPGSC
jgi:diguanylate cyclase (GGDEF)-like protein